MEKEMKEEREWREEFVLKFQLKSKDAQLHKVALAWFEVR